MKGSICILAVLAALLLMGIIYASSAAGNVPLPTREPTPTPRPLVVQYVDAAGIAERARERHARECVETAERAVETGTCSGLLQYAAHYESYANNHRAGSKVYWFKISRPFGAAEHSHYVTYEQMRACVNEGRECPKKSRFFDRGPWKDAMKKVLLRINSEREHARRNQ